MSDYITDMYRPWMLGVQCPRCQTLVWLDTRDVEVYRAYKADHDLDVYAYDCCPNCTEQRIACKARVAEQNRQLDLVYPLWSPVIGPHTTLVGTLYEGKVQ